MGKKKPLNRGQLRRVRANHQKKLVRQQQDTVEPEMVNLGVEQQGTVISRFGQHADIEAQDGTIQRCNIRRTITSLVCGDKVLFRLGKDVNANVSGVVEAVHQRKSVLTRPDLYDGIKIIAANIEQILIVSSVLPSFSSQIIDRYLVAAEDVEIKPIIVLNKSDLLDKQQAEEILPVLEQYRQLGYQVFQVSSKTSEGLEQLTKILKEKVSVFVGQSGVGKSSLINAIAPEAHLVTQTVSDNSGLGQHTTTTAKLLHLPFGGDLVDSPGVREFALWHLPADRVSWCFVEFRDYLGGCKFRDCKHNDDPNCAIKDAVQRGKISQERFDNYHRIIASLDESRHARQFRLDPNH